MANNKKKNDALASLAADMANASQPSQQVTEHSASTFNIARPPKAKGKSVSNIPWYPKSAKLKKELKLLALHEESSLTALIDEGIAMVLKKRGKDIDDYI